jgi:hypothetical protein
MSQKRVIEIPFDINVERETQHSVDEGHQPWRMDAVSVACSKIGALLIDEAAKRIDETAKGNLDNCLKNSSLDRREGDKAIVTVVLNGVQYRVNLERLIKADGIWTPRNIEIAKVKRDGYRFSGGIRSPDKLQPAGMAA